MSTSRLPVHQLKIDELPDQKLTELQPCDILVRPNASWLPGSSYVEGGSIFGHAAIVIRGAEADDETKLLQNVIIFESQARDVPGEYQLRQGPAYHPEGDFRYANLNFSPAYQGTFFRLRLDLSEDQKNAVIQYILSKDDDLSNLRAAKRFKDRPVAGSDKARFWYCSLLVWQAFYDVLGIDLDANKGIYVYPNDLINSPYFDETRSGAMNRVRF